MKTGIELIAEERQRQIEVEGWTAEHDAEHKNGELALAAAAYAVAEDGRENYREENFIPSWWPWDDSWWKPAIYKDNESRIRELQKAGALIAAEIDRLQARKEVQP